MRHVWVKSVLAGFVAALLALVVPAAAATLSGEVTYRERIALPAGASLKVRLVDLTAAGAPTRVEAEAAIASPGQVPLTFTLNFDERVIDTAHDYALVADIVVGSDLWFRNTEPFRLAPLAPATRPTIITSFVGRIAQSSGPSVTPAAPEGDSSLVNVTWRAMTIRGTAAIAGSEPTLLIAEDFRAGGRGGCNSYFAQAAIGEASIRFSAVGATLMACPVAAVSTQETAFFDALAAARFWRIAGDELVLSGSGGTELVRFRRATR
jgi:putative lipoprotein